MISRKLKSTYYALSGPLMSFNGFLKRNLKHYKGTVKVHLGPGQKNYLEGWVNVDSNIISAKTDIWADLRNKLPFRDNSVDFIYSHHVIEHLPDIRYHFEEMFRCLKKGGKIRVGGPNGDSAIAKFVENDSSWFTDYPDKRNSIGGKFENFIFCRREHLSILTFSFLEELAKDAGFSGIQRCLPVKETSFRNFIDEKVLAKEFETNYDFPHTLLIEAEK